MSMQNMQILQEDHGENLLRVKMTTSPKFSSSEDSFVEKSTDFYFCGLVKIQVKRNIYRYGSNYSTRHHQTISISLTKTFEPDSFIYAVNLASVALNVTSRMYYCVNEKSDNEIWQVVHESAGLISEFDLKFVLDFSRSTCPSSGFSFLEDDTELTDFELRGVDGSVHVHKAVLAGFSPVMKTMLNGQWKETKEGAIEIPNTSKETLQHLKDYMYKQRIPATGVEKLAALASCYLMSDLEDRCTIQLLSTLSSTNLTDLLSFSVKHNMEKLMLAILENVQNGVVKVDDMKERYCEKLKESLLKKIFDN